MFIFTIILDLVNIIIIVLLIMTLMCWWQWRYTSSSLSSSGPLEHSSMGKTLSSNSFSSWKKFLACWISCKMLWMTIKLSPERWCGSSTEVWWCSWPLKTTDFFLTYHLSNITWQNPLVPELCMPRIFLRTHTSHCGTDILLSSWWVFYLWYYT